MAAKPADPVTPVDNRARRSDDDATLGSFVDVVDGEHAGRRGVFASVVSHLKKDGYPERVLVHTRDARNEFLSVLYKHVRPAKDYVGGR